METILMNDFKPMNYGKSLGTRYFSKPEKKGKHFLRNISNGIDTQKKSYKTICDWKRQYLAHEIRNRKTESDRIGNEKVLYHLLKPEATVSGNYFSITDLRPRFGVSIFEPRSLWKKNTSQ